MSNQFEAAIRILRGWIHMPEPDNTQIANALRVLEAAGDFTADDKERIGNAIDNIPYYTPISDYKCPGQVLRDKFKGLLAALPAVTK